MRFHKLQNVQIALNYLKHRQVRGAPGTRGVGGPPLRPPLGPPLRGCGAAPAPCNSHASLSAGEAGQHPQR